MSGIKYRWFEVTLEKYGRLKLPTALLKELAEDDRQTFWATVGFGNHIMLWTQSAYEAQVKFLDSLDRNLIEVKKYRNILLRQSAYLECDTQSRIVLPKNLLEKYGIEREAVLVLDNGQIEIWNVDAFNAECDSITPEEYAALNAAMHSGQFDQNRKEDGHVS